LLWISPNGSNAVVTLDASRSSDPDGDPLQYIWQFGQLAEWNSNAISETVLPVGTHFVLLAVTDGYFYSVTNIAVEVITMAQAVERLSALVNLEVARPQPFRATLVAAIDSLNRSNPIAAANQLRAFQNKVRAQIEPATAETLIQAVQDVIDALEVNLRADSRVYMQRRE
jgi:hypothetical protein